jgi:phage terminase large subunit-like protein
MYDEISAVDWLAGEKLARSYRHDNAKEFFVPVEKQLQFIAMHGVFPEVMFMAGNRCGKTETAAYIVACHMTGEYPPWWEGPRFTHPVKVWFAGTSGAAVRDSIQIKLCGEAGDWGSGMIPRRAFVEKPAASRSAPNAFESMKVHHVSGGVSSGTFKTYDQKREDWQSATLDIVWYDEEPPLEHYAEGQTRLSGKGFSLMTFTPLLGHSSVVNRFLQNKPGADGFSKFRNHVHMTLDDATWYSDQQKEQMIANIPEWQRATRILGQPLVGEGRVFMTPVNDLILPNSIPLMGLNPAPWQREQMFNIRKLWGIDFGIGHPFVAVLCLVEDMADQFGRLTGTHRFTVAREIYMTGASAPDHATAMRAIAPDAPVAWPRDGYNREKGSGEELRYIYQRLGLRMLGEHAQSPTQGVSLAGTLASMDADMRAGRFHVDPQCRHFLEEYNQYHFKDGKIVALNDDTISAARYAHMMQRYARNVPLGPSLIPVLARRRVARQAETLNPWTGQPSWMDGR